MRPVNMHSWACASLPYEPYGMYAWQINVKVLQFEYDQYCAHAIMAGKPLDEWLNVALIRQAKSWTSQAGRVAVPHMPKRRAKRMLRFNSVVAAWSLYQRTAEQHGFKQTSKWVRQALNREVGL